MAMNQMEEIKAAADGLDVIGRLGQLARGGFDAICADDLERLKWAGLYVQRPPEAKRFMLRIRVPGGRLLPGQARAVADLADELSGGRLDLTTRQDVQLHGVRIEDVPAALTRMEQAGLSTVQSCGDTPRNVVACPLDGGVELAQRITQALVGRREFSNLPRKFKVAVSTCSQDCAMARIHDVGLRAQGRGRYRVFVGGGLAVHPQAGMDLCATVTAARAPQLVAAIAGLFRDSGHRQRRDHARLKFLVADWGADRLHAEIEARLPGVLKPAGPLGDAEVVGPLDHLGVLPAGDGVSHVGVAVPAGMLTSCQLAALAAAGGREVRLTPRQNVLIASVPERRLRGALRSVVRAGLTSDADDWAGCVQTCTGIEFCRRAIVETKAVAAAIADLLNAAAPLGPRVRVHLSGCPNSCGHVHLAEIGLSGCRLRDGERGRPAFELWFGARLSAGGLQFARPSGRKVAVEDAPAHVARLVQAYHESARDRETFSGFAQRQGWHGRADRQ